MLQKHKILLLILLFAIIIVALGVMLYRSLSPTIRSFLTQNRQAALVQRAKTIQEILPTIQTKNDIKYVFLKKSVAEQVPYIEIRNCFPVPYLTQIYQGNYVKFRNTSNQTKRIKILEKSYTIPANTGQALEITFPSIPMIYEYSCDNSPQPAGYLYVTR